MLVGGAVKIETAKLSELSMGLLIQDVRLDSPFKSDMNVHSYVTVIWETSRWNLVLEKPLNRL